jgi:hypothetical protein
LGANPAGVQVLRFAGHHHARRLLRLLVDGRYREPVTVVDARGGADR